MLLSHNEYSLQIADYLRDGKVEDIGKEDNDMCIIIMTKEAMITHPDTLKNDKDFQVLETFYHIHGTLINTSSIIHRSVQFIQLVLIGVGAATAREWLAKGYRSLNDIREKEHDQLCRDIRMGLTYYDDFRKK